MFDIGFLELILVGIIGLLVLGPERLPVAARTVGRWVGKARRMTSQFTKEINRQIEIEELREDLKKQGESLDINEDIQKIRTTVDSAMKEAELELEAQSEPKPELSEFEPIPRLEEGKAFDAASSSGSLNLEQQAKSTNE